MFAALDPVAIFLSVLAVVGTVLAVVGAIAGAIYIVKSRKITTNNELADSAVASLQAANAGLESRLSLVENESAHCHDLRQQDQLTIARLQGSVDELRSWVTARDLVAELMALTRAGFIASGIEPAKLPPPVERKQPSWQ